MNTYDIIAENFDAKVITDELEAFIKKAETYIDYTTELIEDILAIKYLPITSFKFIDDLYKISMIYTCIIYNFNCLYEKSIQKFPLMLTSHTQMMEKITKINLNFSKEEIEFNEKLKNININLIKFPNLSELLHNKLKKNQELITILTTEYIFVSKRLNIPIPYIQNVNVEKTI